MNFKVVILAIYLFITVACLLSVKTYKSRIKEYFRYHEIVYCAGISILDLYTRGQYIRSFIPALRLPIVVFAYISDEAFTSQMDLSVQSFNDLNHML